MRQSAGDGVPIGRPTLLTSQVEHTIADLIAQGVRMHDICEAIGISETIVYRWLRYGREPQKRDYVRCKQAHRYVRLVASIDAARTERESTVRELLDAAASASSRRSDLRRSSNGFDMNSTIAMSNATADDVREAASVKPSQATL